MQIGMGLGAELHIKEVSQAMMVHAYNPRIWEAKAEGSQV